MREYGECEGMVRDARHMHMVEILSRLNAGQESGSAGLACVPSKKEIRVKMASHAGLETIA